MAEKSAGQLAHGFIKDETVLFVYKDMKRQFGRASLGRVQDWFKRRGILNPLTGKPPTRQGILLSLRRSKEGRDLLSETAHMHYLKRPERGWPEERDKKREESKRAKTSRL